MGWFSVLSLGLAVAGQLVAMATFRAATRWSLPYDDPATLVRVHEMTRHGRSDVSPELFRSVAGLSLTPFKDFGCAHSISAELGGDRRRRIFGLAATKGFERAASAVAVGRPAADLVADGPTAVVSSLVAREAGAGVGHVILLNGVPHRITGILRSGFRFPESSPQTADVIVATPDGALRDQESTVRCAARITVPMSQAQSVLNAWSLDGQIRLEPLAKGPELEQARWPMLAALATILLAVLACVNGVGLLVGSQLQRLNEVALRSMLGASPARLMLPFLSEVLVLLVFGLVLAALTAFLLQRLIHGLVVRHVALVADPAIGFPEAATVVAIVVASLFVACLVPAWRLRAHDPLSLVRGPQPTGRAWSRTALRQGFSVAQIGIAFVFLSAAMMLGLSVRAAARADIGLVHRSGLFIDFDPGSGRNTLFERRDRMLDLLRQRPDVRHVAGVFGGRPYGGGTSYLMARVPGRIELKDRMRLRFRMVSSGFFEAIGMQVEEGRTFNAADDRPDGPPSAIINSRARRLLYAGEQTAIGQPLVANGMRRVVGVVADARLRAVELDTEPELYIPLLQAPLPIASLVILPNPPGAAVAESIKEALAKEFPDVKVTRASNIADELSAKLAPRRMGLWTVASAALLANVLCLIGLVASIRLSLTSRSREVSIRLALGQSAKSVIWLLARQCIAVITFGLLLGSLLWLLSRRVVERHLVGLEVPTAESLTASALLILGAGICVGLAVSRQLVRRELGGIVRALAS